MSMVIETRQHADELAMTQTRVGIGVSITSALVRSKGHGAIKILSRSDVAGRLDIFQAISNPVGGPVFIRTKSVASAADPVSGEQVIFVEDEVFGEFARVVYVNGGAVQTAFEISAYLLPVSVGSGGSGVGGVDNVVGGSGAVYPTIAAAILGETPFSATEGPYTPQGGTAPSVLVGPGAMSAVDDFYKDWYVVNQSGASTTNGMAAQFARVSSYVGATRTLTLDKPLNFVAELAFLLIKPVYVSLLKDRLEDVTLTAPPIGVVIELTGHRLEGLINVVSSRFVRVTNGDVSNGIDWSGDGGVLWLENCNVSRRDETIYAVLMRPFTLAGRVVLSSCDFYGRVAGRMAQCGWEIQNCRNWGVADTANGVPYALIEAVPGAAQSIVVTQVDIIIDSEFSGAFFYAEGALAVISGATAYLSVQGSIRSNRDFFGTAVASRNFAIARAIGAGVITLTVTTGGFNVDASVVSINPNLAMAAPEIVNYGLMFSALCLDSATGASTLTISFPSFASALVTISGHCWFSVLSVIGATATSGSGVVGGTSGIVVRGNDRSDLFTAASVLGPLTGGVTVSITMIASKCSVGVIFLLANQTAGAPTVTVSGVLAGDNIFTFRLFQLGTISVSVGTYLVSGAFITVTAASVSVALNATVSGGTWTVSAPLTATIVNEAGTVSYGHAGTGGTLTISGAQTYVGGRLVSLRLASATGAGATVINSGATITFENVAISQTNGILARATTATSTARCAGAVLFAGCTFETAMTMLEATLGGGVAEGPSALRFETCDFRSTWLDRTGAGTFTWATATLQWKNTHIEGLVTALGTSFTTVEAIETRFSGNAAEKSITLTGTRPTTLRYWDCSFAARFDDLLPEVIDEYDVLPAAAALVQGQPVTNNAANQYVVCIATSIVRGTSLDAPAGAASRVVAVRTGRVFAAVNAAVVNGDNLGLDLATPTQYTVVAFIPGQNAGFALEAAGATVAGKAYSQIDQR